MQDGVWGAHDQSKRFPSGSYQAAAAAARTMPDHNRYNTRNPNRKPHLHSNKKKAGLLPYVASLRVLTTHYGVRKGAPQSAGALIRVGKFVLSPACSFFFVLRDVAREYPRIASLFILQLSMDPLFFLVCCLVNEMKLDIFHLFTLFDSILPSYHWRQ